MRPSAKFGYLLGLVVGILILVVFFWPGLESFHTLGPANTGHEDLDCQDCHIPAGGFQHQAISNTQCLDCHDNPEDVHPVQRFNEPRFAEARASIHPERCVSCHREHQGILVTIGPTFCVQCHQALTLKNDPIDVSHDRLINLGNWETCLGCHDYHGSNVMTVRQSIKDRLSLKAIVKYFEGGVSPYYEQ